MLKRAILVGGACMAVAATYSPRTHAQFDAGQALNQYQPAEPGDAFLSVPSPWVGGHLEGRGSLTYDFSKDPLVLVDENGEFKISRKKKLDASGAPVEGDEPLMGRDYEIYAYKSGYSAQMRQVSAKSFAENVVDTIGLEKQNTLGGGLPKPEVSLRDNLELMQFVVSAGAGPKINR